MRMRLIFGLIGAAACLVAALFAEFLFRHTGLARSVDESASQVLIYRSNVARDISRRVEAAGGKTGEVQISLAWNNDNDLDLWCVDPNGERIWYPHKQSRSGGVLDVDANAATPYSSTPVENIRWPFGRAPAGHYAVFVNYFKNHGGPDLTRYTVIVKERGHTHQFNGSLVPEQTRSIYQFDLGAGTWSDVGWLPSVLRELLITGLWGMLLAGLLALALAGGQHWIYQRHYREPLLSRRRFVRVVLCGLGAGFAGGVIGQMLFSLLQIGFELPPDYLVRGVSWALLGAVLGWILAQRMPNLPGPAALWAGLLGGALGAWSFISTLGTGSDAFGRVAAATVMGLLIGLMIRLVLEAIEEPDMLHSLQMTLHPLQLRSMRARAVGTLRPTRSPRLPEE